MSSRSLEVMAWAQLDASPGKTRCYKSPWLPHLLPSANRRNFSSHAVPWSPHLVVAAVISPALSAPCSM